jgi:hypothetical protein
LREGPPLKIKIDGSPGFAWKPRPYFDSEVFIEFTYRKILGDFINKYLWDTTLIPTMEFNEAAGKESP